MLVCMCFCVTMFLIPRGSTLKSYTQRLAPVVTSLSFSLIFLQLLMLRFSRRLGLILRKSSKRYQIDLWIPNFLIGCTELSGDIENSTHIKIQKKDKGDWLELREKQPAARRTRKLSISTTISFLMSAKEIKPSRNMSTKILSACKI